MLKILTQIARIVIGLEFIYSGFVKLVDPMGTMFKMEEYFSESVLNMEYFVPYALLFAILLVIGEFVLGVMLLVGFKPKFTVWSIFGLNLVFLFLTWYSYKYNVVTDCGCFGDALKISPAETFYKNVINVALIVVLVLGLKYIKPLVSEKIASLTAIASLLISGGIVFYVLNHLPVVDFRAYSIGKNIEEGMKYQGDGEVPPIHDFAIETDDGDLLEEMLKKDKAMLVILRNFDKAEKDGIKPIAQVAKQAKAKGYAVYVLTASYIEDLAKVQQEFGMPYPFGFCDDTALKTAIRANPGVITVEKGTITGKWNWTDADDVVLK